MPVTVSPNAREDVPITDHGKNAMNYTIIFGRENKDNSTSCGLFTVEKALETNTFIQPFTVFFIVLGGELDLEDQAKPGEHRTLKAGDVVHIDKGTVIRLTSPTQGKGFYVAEIGKDLNLHDHRV